MQITQDENELLTYLLAADMSFLSLREQIVFKNKLDSFYDIALMSVNDISSIVGRVVKPSKWDIGEIVKKAQRALVLIKNFEINYVCYDKSGYPDFLKEMQDPPLMLFYRGNISILKKRCISVVGSRRASVAAAKAAVNFSKSACDKDFAVVSGLAFGIDINAHMGALQSSSGGTVAVLPSGIDTIVPASHKRIAAGILSKGGCILSEYVPGTPALPFRYVQRNRIIAALSEATIVIQAPCGSGALITADFALQYGRDVVLHACAFSEEAKLLENLAVKELNTRLLYGQKVKYKLQNTVEQLRIDGAPVINNFEEYLEYCSSSPGTVDPRCDGKQMSLF